MSPARPAREVPAVGWWLRLWLRLLALLRGARPVKELRAARDDTPLPDDLHELYLQLAGKKGLVADTMERAVEDYRHLRAVIMGPGAGIDAVDDVTMLAEAEEALREMLQRAPHLQSLVELAAGRERDRKGREATGEAMLAFGDRGRALHDLSSSALRWASSQSADDLARMQECVDHLSNK